MRYFLRSFAFYNSCTIRLSAFVASGGLRAPRSPCGRARPAPASDGCAALARSADGVWRYMTTATPFVVGATKSVIFFVRCDSRRSTTGGCFPQTPLSSPHRLHAYIRAVLRNLFRRPCAPFFGRAGLHFGRAPQRAARPLIPGRARPAPARRHLLWRLRAYAFRATWLKKQTLSPEWKQRII